MNENMTPSQVGTQASERPAAEPRAATRLRLWPGVVILGLLWSALTLPGLLAPATPIQFYGMFFGPMVCTLALLAWWVFGSRVSWLDGILVVLTFALLAGAAFAVFDPTMGMVVILLRIVPVVATVWIAWLLLTPLVPWPVRRVGMLGALLLTCGFFGLLRSEGVDGAMWVTLKWRWIPTALDNFQEQQNRKRRDGQAADPAKAKIAALKVTEADWPGFRGAERDARRTGVRIATDWARNPPKKVWQNLVGAGWGSFAAVGNCLFTQEQRKDENQDKEAVVCYDATTGEELWVYLYPGLFTEQMAGPGPRATPTFHDGKIYALGAAGRLNCLDASSGQLLWSRDIVADGGGKLPQWGFASSPLVVQGVVTVVAAGPEGKSVLGYDAASASGELLWSAGNGQNSYCSLQRARLGGFEQLLVSTDVGLAALHPTSGKVLWEHSWPLNGMARVVQPAILDDADVLLGTGFGKGTRRLHVASDGKDWQAEEVWTSTAICPYYNDYVVHKGHIYGFDGEYFTCVNLDKGKKKWRERGYGNGQVLLLADQDLLLVLTEQGAVALVEANPAEHKELGRFQALTERKTWNHPVVAHGKLFVRNDAEAACYELPALGGADKTGNK